MNKPAFPQTVAGQVEVDVVAEQDFVVLTAHDAPHVALVMLTEGEARELADWLHRAASDLHERGRARVYPECACHRCRGSKGTPSGQG